MDTEFVASSETLAPAINRSDPAALSGARPRTSGPGGAVVFGLMALLFGVAQVASAQGTWSWGWLSEKRRFHTTTVLPDGSRGLAGTGSGIVAQDDHGPRLAVIDQGKLSSLCHGQDTGGQDNRGEQAGLPVRLRTVRL